MGSACASKGPTRRSDHGSAPHIHSTLVYDRTSHIGKLDKALDEANAKGWAVVDMKTDWKRVFPFESTSTDSRTMELMK